MLIDWIITLNGLHLFKFLMPFIIQFFMILIALLQGLSQRSKLTYLSPALDLYQMWRWYVPNEEKKKECTNFPVNRCKHSLNSCFSLPSLFQRLGRMSLVQLRTLIWLTIPHQRGREREEWGWCWDRLGYSCHGIGWLMHAFCALHCEGFRYCLTACKNSVILIALVLISM